MSLTVPGLSRAVVECALDSARDHLLDLQSAEGWWKGELESNVSTDAEDVLLREFLGIRTAEQTDAAARWIRRSQRADGTWSNFYLGTPELSTTVEAYVALRLAGDARDARHMVSAAEYVRSAGGIEATRFFTRFWLALSGLWSWDDVAVLPPELIYLPAWFPLNIYDWSSWARITLVPLTVVSALRPRRELPFDVAELHSGRHPQRTHSRLGWESAFLQLDRVLHHYERRPVARLRAAALRRCSDWIVARQEGDGSWAGIQPPMVYSLIALRVLGYELDHPVMVRGLRALDRFTIREITPDGPERRVEASQSPVWDTVLAIHALADAGVAGDHPALVKAAEWVIAREVRSPGDWRVRRPHGEPGGWAFEFDNDTYPDTDDTAEAVLALREVRLPAGDGRVEDAIGRAVRWLTEMQCEDGGWAAYDAENTRQLCYRVPFADFGAVIDPPSADVTAHVVEALCNEGAAASSAVRRGVAWLLRAQEQDGSWFGRWGVNHVYGTGAVLPALVAAGVRQDSSAIRRAVAWLDAHQNDDGGWGEDPRSYADPSHVGRGTSTPSQTAWALLGLLAAARGQSPAVQRGVRWLVEHQRPDGTWDEPQFTGTGFPRDFYLNYHLYRLLFPIAALGRYLRA